MVVFLEVACVTGGGKAKGEFRRARACGVRE